MLSKRNSEIKPENRKKITEKNTTGKKTILSDERKIFLSLSFSIMFSSAMNLDNPFGIPNGTK